MILTIHVLGRPAPQGSKRGGSAAGTFIENSAYLPAWRQAVKVGTYAAYRAAGISPAELPLFPAGVPVVFERIEFRVIRSEQCAAAGSEHPIGKPDVDKLLRSTLDALGGRTDPAKTARLFFDDSQVVEIRNLRKVWAPAASSAGAMIVISDGRD